MVTSPSPSEEKDIFYLFSQIGKFFMSIVKGCMNLVTYTLRITYRRWLIVVLTIVLCIVGVMFYVRPVNKRYKVEGLVRLNGVDLSMVYQRYAVLEHGLPQEKSHSQSVAQLLEIPVEQAKQLSHFKVFECIDIMGDGIQDYVDYNHRTNKLDTCYHVMRDRLCLQFRTSDITNVPMYEQVLLKYLCNDSTCKIVFEEYRDALLSERDLCRSQIKKLDDLSTHLYSEKNLTSHQAYSKIIKTEDVTEIEPFQVQIIGQDLQWHLQWLTSIEQRLVQCLSPIQPINHFVIYEHPVNGTLKCTCIGLLIGWILGVLLATIWEYGRSICRWLKQ